jgi:hypothetical protein
MAVGLSIRPRLARQMLAVKGRERWRMSCLVATLLLGSSPHGRYVPAAGIDESWVTALNTAAGQQLDFGKDMVFTYGPLGFLDAPMAIHPAQLTVALVFYAFAVCMLWFALDLALGRTIQEPWAALAAFVLSVVLASYSSAALELLIAAPVFALLALHSGWGRAWVPATLAVTAALLIQIKLTDGVFVALFASITAICARESAARRAIEVVIVFGATLITGWTLAGQALADLWPWLGGSIQIVIGYSDAMAAETSHALPSYILASVLAFVIVAAALRWTRTVPLRPRIGVHAIILAALYVGFKEGFVRHEPFHQAAYFSACVPLLAVLVGIPRWRYISLAAVSVAVVFSANSLAWLNPFTAPSRWTSAAQFLFDAHYRDEQLADEKSVLQRLYDVPPDMLTAVGDHPVMVDPWESAAAWAYSLHYHPVPVFQTYSAYTTALDELNAQALRDDPADQMVLRQPRGFGLRDQMWTSPQYTLTLACRYAVQSTSLHWMLLHKATNVCGPTRTVDTQRVRAGQAVTVPTAGPHQIVIARFTADGGGVGNAVVNALWKDVHRFYVTADGTVSSGSAPQAPVRTEHMLARPLAGGPLIMSLPKSLGWPDRFESDAPYHQLSFSSPGQVRFQTITVHSNK